MDLELVFLGTSGSMPTAQRAPTALLLRRGGERGPAEVATIASLTELAAVL